MNRCIFCSKSPDDKNNKDFWSVEHIIPKALGNEKLILIDSVCKDCNSKLGSNVDGYFLNNFLIELERRNLNLKGQSGKVPNPFIDGTDQDGNKVIWKKDHPEIVSKVDIIDDHIKIIANTKEEAKDIFFKIADRKNLTEAFKERGLKTIDKSDGHLRPLTINVSFGIEYNRFFMEMVKIAYEFAIYKIGEEYLNDPRAIEIREYLNSAIRGEMKDNCPEIKGVILPSKELMYILRQFGLKNYHLLILCPNEDDDLYVFISLFMHPLFSFWVFLSANGNRYQIDENSCIELIEVK